MIDCNFRMSETTANKNYFTIVQQKKLPVGGETGESLAADGVTICDCADATVPFVCDPLVCEDCCEE